jgi:hypothetical protein
VRFWPLLLLATLVAGCGARGAGQVYAAAAEGKVFPDDIVGLARTMARKMKAEEK